ncbi:MAG: pyruvate kinase [Desulfuromonadaceae bacterium]
MTTVKKTLSSSMQWDEFHLDDLVDEISTIRAEMLSLEEKRRALLEGLHPAFQKSGANLLHYLALRHRDIRPLQKKLASLGLSSLGRTEAHVLATLNSLLAVLSSLGQYPLAALSEEYVSFSTGRHLLEQHTDALLGPRPSSRDTRIMVTMPSEAATDYLLIRELVASGMNCMRINCAHDNESVWQQMIENLRRAKRELGKKCWILMDLGGPKLRTGSVEPSPTVLKWRPVRDHLGFVLEPARILLRPDSSDEEPDNSADAVIPVSEQWLQSLNIGDSVVFSDARKAARNIKIVGKSGSSFWGESINTTYLTPGIVLHRVASSKKNSANKSKDHTTVSYFPPAAGFIHLSRGDTLLLTRDLAPGRGAILDKQGRILSYAAIGCSLSEVFDSVKAGERIFFDDGKIAGIIRAVHKDRIKIEIISARPQGVRLGPEKGINLPDSRLQLPALTAKDLSDLNFIVHHAHMVGLSFAQEPSDVIKLREELGKLKGERLGIMLKIETRRGFEMLPDLIFAAMTNQTVGIMIARGDLAVECGYERLAEIQEEILWLCEAAHMPVIWATQVLENLAKTGIPARAEITDAAMSGRAECVMLNKGPHIVDAVRVLDNILQRMADHQTKKNPWLRQLHWWEQSQ